MDCIARISLIVSQFPLAMAFGCSVLRYFILLAVSLGAAQCLQPCNCTQEVLDCSFRMKTVVLDSELHACSARTWIFRGNNLRRFPTLPDYTVTRYDISDNELGLTDMKPLTVYRLNYLDVSGNGLRALKVSNCQDLEHLNISYNAIDNLTDIGVCRNLRTMRVAYNNLSFLSDSAFSRWNYLTFLDLSGNALLPVPSTAFQDLRHLNTLYLSETHVLPTLSENTFSSLTDLNYLYLNGNKLSNPSAKLFQDLVNLKVLHLQNNKLQTLPESIFKSLVRLQSLDLDDNQLLSLPSALFARLHSLEELSVRSNRLMSVPSLRECLGPLRAVLLNDNLITRVDEAAARSYFRLGFQLGDLRGNPLRNDSMPWKSSADMDVKQDSSGSCGTIALIPPGHGALAFCICHSSNEV